MKGFIYSAINLFGLAILVSVFSIGMQAQTTRRNKPKPLATPPTRVLTDAEIISQGGIPDDTVELAPVEKPTPKPPATNAGKIKDLNDRVTKLEGGQGSKYDEQQKRLLMNLDIISRAEARAESLRKQLFEMIEKENTIAARLDQIEYEMRPEVIERTLQIAGSLRPEEIRENRRKMLEAERTNLQALLTIIRSNRTNLEASVQRAEQIVEKLRTKLEKDIDDALSDDKPADQ